MHRWPKTPFLGKFRHFGGRTRTTAATGVASSCWRAGGDFLVDRVLQFIVVRVLAGTGENEGSIIDE